MEELTRLDLKNLLKAGERGHFPRPDCVRTPSFLLDGEWLVLPDRRGLGLMQSWHRLDFGMTIAEGRSGMRPAGTAPLRVRVPFSLESDINQQRLAPAGYTPEKIASTRRFWYFRRFKRPEDLSDALLRFGAVDYRASVWMNGEYLGSHEGGYTPFSFPVRRLADVNVLTVMVEDSPSPGQVRGKQTFLKKPFMVWYDGCTGIWQNVWLEPLGRVRMADLRVRREEGAVALHIGIEGVETGIHDATVVVRLHNSQIFGSQKTLIRPPIREYTGFTTLDAMGKGTVDMKVPEKLFTRWTHDWPAVHPIEIAVSNGKTVLDRLHLLYGLRDIAADRGQITLNGKRLYQMLLLDQGYYGSGHYTPESPDEFRRDIELMKKCGFNGCRMHEKIEHPAFLYWADLLGFLVWEEMPSYYFPSVKNMAKMENQLHEVMARDALHPSVITLVLYNESWGIYSIFMSKKARDSVVALYRKVKGRYPGYLVIDNSGFHHLESDVCDIHHYLPSFEETGQFYGLLSSGVREAPLWYNFFRMLAGRENVQTPYLRGYGEKEKPLLVSEFGGYGFAMYRHPECGLEDFLREHFSLIAGNPLMQGFCYTQFTDTFQEQNGLFTADRRAKAANIPDILKKAFARKSQGRY